MMPKPTLASSANNLDGAGYDKFPALLLVSLLAAPIRMRLWCHLVKKRAPGLHCAMRYPCGMRWGIPIHNSYLVQYLSAIGIVMAPICVGVLSRWEKEYTIQSRREGRIFTQPNTLPEHFSAQHSGHKYSYAVIQSLVAAEQRSKISGFNDLAGRLFYRLKMIMRHRLVLYLSRTLA